jgi:hypothetical protein
MSMRWTILAHRFLPAVAVALDVKPTWFDAIFNDSQLTRLMDRCESSMRHGTPLLMRAVSRMRRPTNTSR